MGIADISCPTVLAGGKNAISRPVEEAGFTTEAKPVVVVPHLSACSAPAPERAMVFFVANDIARRLPES
eukprot:1099728-Pyramimonas_sp.AAC.1